MSPDRASQFRLRDLIAAALVVLLLATLVPSCASEGMTPSRRNICQSNQYNIVLAALQFAEAHRHYPGYSNTVGTRTTSYLVPLMPYMEKSDVYQEWSKPDGTTAPPQATKFFSLLVCPSNPPPDQSGTPNSYVINAGQADPPNDITPGVIEANGLATDQTVPEPVLVSPQFVVLHDGAVQTLLTSENIQAQSWALTDKTKLYPGTTFLWWNSPPKGTRDYRINVGKDLPNKPRDPIYSRPSSNHPGGAVVGFCAGNVRFIAEDIDYDVYKQLMTPNGAASGDTVNREITDNDY